MIWFDRTDTGDVPRRMRWVRRQPPARPDRAPRTADDVNRAFSLAMGSVTVPGDLSPPAMVKQLYEQSETTRTQWLAPYAALLRQAGTCAFLKLPLEPLPDLSVWQDQNGPWTPSDFSLPSQFWDARLIFVLVRTMIGAFPVGVGRPERDLRPGRSPHDHAREQRPGSAPCWR